MNMRLVYCSGPQECREKCGSATCERKQPECRSNKYDSPCIYRGKNQSR